MQRGDVRLRGKKVVRYVLAVIIILFAFNLFKVDVWDANEKLLAEEIITTDMVGKKVNLTEFTPFDWDTVYAFSPYARKEHIYETVGYNWARISQTVSEGMNQIVFLNDEKVVCYVYGYPENNKYGIFFDSTNPDDEVTVLYAENNPVFDVFKNRDTVYLEHRK